MPQRRTARTSKETKKMPELFPQLVNKYVPG